MTNDFFEWLDQCPVDWLLLDYGDSERSYKFFGIDSEDEDDE